MLMLPEIYFKPKKYPIVGLLSCSLDIQLTSLGMRTRTLTGARHISTSLLLPPIMD
jgi:hypothetical protein